MKIMVETMLGDACITFYNKQGEIIHTEQFSSKKDTQYVRELPISDVEYGYTKALYSGRLEYKVVA